MMTSDVSGRIGLYTRVYLNTIYRYKFAHKELENAANEHYDVLYGGVNLNGKKPLVVDW